MGEVREAFNRLHKFIEAGEGFTGPLSKAYREELAVDIEFGQANEQFKADIQTVLNALKATGGLKL